MLGAYSHEQMHQTHEIYHSLHHLRGHSKYSRLFGQIVLIREIQIGIYHRFLLEQRYIFTN